MLEKSIHAGFSIRVGEIESRQTRARRVNHANATAQSSCCSDDLVLEKYSMLSRNTIKPHETEDYKAQRVF